MDNNTAIVLGILIVVLMITTLGFLIYYDSTDNTEFEVCAGACKSLPIHEESECMLQCIKHFSNCSILEVEE